MAAMQSYIEETGPFRCAQEEALLSLLRTADRLNRAVQRAVQPWGITTTQYNVLRILRGAQSKGPTRSVKGLTCSAKGLTCSELGSRMITADPDITRLLARLVALGFIRQQRDARDRRIVRNSITQAARTLLADMDSTMQRLPVELLGHISPPELQQLIGLLEVARRVSSAALSMGENHEAEANQDGDQNGRDCG